jgi:C1A family cysteine protease
MEGAHFIKSGSLLKLSEEQLVSCDKVDAGCKGGLEWDAMKYLMTNGQETEAEYPYKAFRLRRTCNYEASKGQVKVTSVNYVAQKSATALRSSVAAGPTCIGVNAAAAVFQMYNQGILNSATCKPNQDHAVTAIGYGAEGGMNYFIVRNSWGGNWGEHGYIRISDEAGVNNSGICGILVDATRPSVTN